MYVSSIVLDRFGACSHLRLENLGEGLQVIFGAHGSGKTTIVDFLRSLWTGFDPSLRADYLPAESRGFGGTITVQTPEGRHSISRYDDGSREGRLYIARTRLSGSIPTENLSDSSAQGMNFERADGAVIGRRNVQDLLGNVTSELLDRVFLVDFQARPRIEDLLAIADARGLPFADRPIDSDRLRNVEGELAELNEQLARVAVPTETLAVLQSRLRDVLREIESLEGNARRHIEEATRLRQRLTSSIADLEGQEVALRAECAELEAACTDQQSRLPHVENAPSVPSDNDLTTQLRGLDVQLARWKRTLRDISARKQRAAERSDNRQLGGAAVQAAQADPRQRLRGIENRIVELQLAAGQLPNRGSSCECQQLQAALADDLSKMRDEVYQLCNDLNRWQAHQEHQQAVAERDQLARCECELRQSIRTLAERRATLVRQVVATMNAPATAVQEEHAAFCECAEHPRVALSAIPPLRNLGRADELTALRAEITRLTERREQTWQRVEDLASELTRQREQLRGLGALPPDLSGEIAGRRAAVTRLEQSIREHEWRLERRQELANLEEEARRLREEYRPPGLLAEASEYLRRLTSGDYVRLHGNSSRELTVEDCHGGRKLYHALDQGGRDQAYLALELAVVAACERQGIRAPLVLNAAFTHYPSKDVRGALELLRDLGRDRQVLCFTRHEHVESLSRSLNIPVLVLKHTTAGTRPLETVIGPASVPSRIAPATIVGTRPRTEARKLPLREFELPVFDEPTPDYYLYEHDPIDRAPSLETHHVERLRRLGLHRVGDLLRVKGADLADDLRPAGIALDQFQTWQSQARLTTRVRGLRPYDARILVACGVADPDQLRTMNPTVLRARVKEFSQSPEGKSLLLSGTEFELSRVTDWFNEARARELREQRADEVRRQSPHHRDRRDESGHSSVVPFNRDQAVARLVHRRSPVVDAPTIGPSMAKRLEKVRVYTVDDLLRADPQTVADGLGIRRVTHQSVRQWQQQAELVCRVPHLPGFCAQLLVALGVTSAEALAAMQPSELLAKVQPFANSLEGKRFLRNSPPPDLETLATWISGARQAGGLNAA